MTQKLQGNYNNKLDDYKTDNLSRTQNHCIKFIHSYHVDQSEESLNKTQLSDLARGISDSKIAREVNDLIEKDMVKVLDDNKLALTEKGKQHV